VRKEELKYAEEILKEIIYSEKQEVDEKFRELR